jgi:hypothetical protein
MRILGLKTAIFGTLISMFRYLSLVPPQLPQLPIAELKSDGMAGKTATYLPAANPALIAS